MKKKIWGDSFKRIGTGAGILSISNMVGAAVSIVTIPLVLRLLSVSDFGQLVTAQSFSAFLCAVLIPQTWQLVANDSFHAHPVPLPGRYSQALLFDVLCASCFIVSFPLTGALYHYLLDWDFSPVLLFLIFFATGCSSLTSPLGVLRYYSDVRALSLVNLLAPCLRIVLAPLLLLAQPSLAAEIVITVLYIVPEFLRLGLLFFLAKRSVLAKLSLTDLIDREVVRYFLWQIAGRFSRAPIEFLDKVFIGVVFGDVAAATYGVGRRLGSAFSLLVEPVTQLTFGVLGRIHRAESASIAIRTVGVLVLISIPLGVLAGMASRSDYMMSLLVGSSSLEEFRNWETLFQWAIAISLAATVASYSTSILLLLRREAVSMYVDFVGVVGLGVSIIANYEGSLPYTIFGVLLVQLLAKSIAIYASSIGFRA